MNPGRVIGATVAMAMGPLCAVAVGGCGGSSDRRVAPASSRAASARAAPPKTVAARRLQPSAPGGLRRGTAVSSAFIGIRVFADRRRGFAITDLPHASGGTYPVATADGGRTWRTDGPVLHVPAAQGPLAVDQAGLAGRRIYFAWCGACNTVIDVTPDAGGHLWQTFMPGNVLAVLSDANARAGLTAIVAGPNGAPNGRGASLWVYQSADGRRWSYERSLTGAG
jgi:hypothetical protein